MALTPTQIRALLAEIERLHDSAVVLIAGPRRGSIDKDRIADLQRRGYLPKGLGPGLVVDAYRVGKVQSAADAVGLGRPWARAIEEARGTVLTDVDRRALDYVAESAGQSMAALRGGATDKLMGIVGPHEAQAQLAHFVEAMKPALAEGILARRASSAVASDLARLAGDWSRDWRRVAHTELHTAHQRGSATAMLERAVGVGRDPGSVEVEIVVRPDACDICPRLYLDADGRPRRFRLVDLIAAGSNRGRKAREWVAVLPPAHPNCACRVRRALPRSGD